jgi:RimJ/RimL family protein N-acetyltransferase
VLHSEQNGITMREVRESDLAQYRDLRLEALKSSPLTFGADYQESLNQPGSAWLERLRMNVNNHFATIFVAEQNGVLIGMTGVRRDYGLKAQHNATVWGVYVRSSARGSGLAGTLLAHAMLWARQMGVTRLELKVSTQNAAALALYTRAGFEIAGTLHGTLRIAGQIVDEYILERAL